MAREIVTSENRDAFISKKLAKQNMTMQPTEDYKIAHRPTLPENGAARLHESQSLFDTDMNNTRKFLQFHGSGDEREQDVVNILKKVQNDPDAKVTIYRGMPKEASGINSGDWVTLHPEVAEDYVWQAQKYENRPGKVVSMVVPASHVTASPDSLLENGYFPP